MKGMKSIIPIVVAILATVTTISARVWVVAPSGGNFVTIQDALNTATAGDTILVREKNSPYYEQVYFPHSGNANDGYITLMAYPGEHPVLDGTGGRRSNMMAINNQNYIRIIGFEIRNLKNVNDGSAIRITGYASHIEIRDNIIHDIRGTSAMAITVYGTSSQPIEYLVIDNNQVYDCEPSPSEAITLNGNVRYFEVTNNLVRDVNNIGIDFIGGETDIQSDTALVARNGICRGNQVYRANSNYGDGYAAGIYVDGGRDIVIENNIVSGCDLGIEIGAENAGMMTRGVVVRNNILYLNEKTGLVFGGYADYTGRVKHCQFTGNTLYKNDVLHVGWGELWIQYASDCDIRNNIFYANDQNRLSYSESHNVNNVLDYNLWFTESGDMEIVWRGHTYTSFQAFQQATGQSSHGLFSDPLFVDASANDFHLQQASPAIDRGDPNYQAQSGETDIDGQARVYNGRVDIGADEYGSVVKIGRKMGRSIPSQFQLLPAYPNPFNGRIIIPLQVAESNATPHVWILDALGRRIKQLNPVRLQPHAWQCIWQGMDNAGVPVAAGVYYVVASIGSTRQIEKIVLNR